MSTSNSLLLGTTNGVCVNSIITDKIREYMMSDSSSPATCEINKENTSVIHENKTISLQDPVSTTDLGLPSTLNVTLHNSGEPCPHSQDMVTASIRRIGNSLDALLHESKNASHVKAVKKIVPLSSQHQKTDRLFIASDQIRYKKNVTLHDICEEYIQFITVNSAEADEEVTTTSENETATKEQRKNVISEVEPDLQIIRVPVMPTAEINLANLAQKLKPIVITPPKKRTGQISVITVNENLSKNTTFSLRKRSVEDIPVAAESECEKSNGDSEQNTTECKLDKKEETAENVISNGIKSTDTIVKADEEKLGPVDPKLAIAEQTDETTADADGDVDHAQITSDAQNESQSKTPSPVSSIPNGVDHEEETNEKEDVDMVNEVGSEPVTTDHETEETAPSEVSKQDEVVSAMDVDESVADEPMDTAGTSEFDSKQTENDETGEEMAEQSTVDATDASSNDERKASDSQSYDDASPKTVELESEIARPTDAATPPSEVESSTRLSPLSQKDDEPSSPVPSESADQVSSEAPNEDEVIPSPPQSSAVEGNSSTEVEAKGNDDEPAITDEVTNTDASAADQTADLSLKVRIKEEAIVENGSSTGDVTPAIPEVPVPEENSAIVPEPTITSVTTTTTVTLPVASNAQSSSTTTSVVAGVKRRADTANEELEGERDGRISCSSSSGSDVENNQDYKRIRFDESIFEEDERERLIREFVERTTDNPDDINKNCDKLQHEIAALSDLARAKELEWNSIIRLLKLKEEMLERVLFKKRSVNCPTKADPDAANLSKLYKSIATPASSESAKTNRNESNMPSCISSQVTVVPISSSTTASGTLHPNVANVQEAYKPASPLVAPTFSDKVRLPHRPILPKPAPSAALQQTSSAQQSQATVAAVQPTPHTLPQTMLQGAGNQLLIDQNSVIGEGRQGPLMDVKTIIAEYQSKNPETGPRRGRRNISFTPRAQEALGGPRFLPGMPNNALLSMANMALGSGPQVRTNVSSTTHNDLIRPGGLYLGQDGSALSAALNRPDLQIRQANTLDSFMLSISAANSGNSSQSNSGNANVGNIPVTGAGVNIATTSNVNMSGVNLAGSVGANNTSFQEALVKFAKMNEKRSDISTNAAVASAASGMHVSSNKNASHLLPPPPYPEVTLHPVVVPQYSNAPQNSLLHGILTKSSGPNRGGPNSGASGGAGGGGGNDHHASSSVAGVAGNMKASSHNLQHRPTNFSPTLARLLTAPERSRNSRVNAGAASRNTRSALSEILNNKKTRTEVTITPVTTSASNVTKNGSDVVMVDDDDESEATDRLVIDEGREAVADATSNVIPADQVPECQGCHKKAAQFVCAGCGNQWYCSRECQVQAWEEHSEMCSG